MEITQEQFVTNFEALSEEDQNAVGVIFENNPPEVIISLASVFGVTLQGSGEQEPQEPMQEPQEPMPEPSEEISEPEQEIPQTDEMSPLDREMMALGDEVATTGPIQKEGADNSGVADDVPMDAEQESFIINAAAVDEVGELDLEQRIIQPAIEALQKEGIKITVADLKRPQEQVNGDVPVAVSNGEYYIPRVLARKIGYGLLKKINDRGKPETEKKLEEQKEQQPQEPQAEMQAALGKRIQMNEGGEVEMLARLLIAESIPGEDEKETYRNMQSVANVVLNRLKDKKTDFRKYKNVKDVISDTSGVKQFSGYQDKNYKIADKDRRYSTALDIANKAVAGTLEDITEGATFFYNPNETKPENAKFFEDRLKSGRFKYVGRIGSHDILFDTHSSLPKRSIPEPKEKPKPINSPPEGRELAEDTSFMADTNSPPEGRELLKEPPRGMRSGLDKVQPVMDKREITQFPERVLQ